MRGAKVTGSSSERIITLVLSLTLGCGQEIESEYEDPDIAEPFGQVSEPTPSPTIPEEPQGNAEQGTLPEAPQGTLPEPPALHPQAEPTTPDQPVAQATRVNCLDDTKPYADGDYSCFDWRTHRAEAWRPLLEKYFEPEDMAWAIKVMNCESHGNPNAENKRSGAAGLFQHLQKYWPKRAKNAGFPGVSPFDPEANIAATARLYSFQGGDPWSCKGFWFFLTAEESY